jgi:hypothetical protein
VVHKAANGLQKIKYSKATTCLLASNDVLPTAPQIIHANPVQTNAAFL